MKRDWRLLVATLCIVTGAVLATIYHFSWIDWVVAFQTGDWEAYGREYSVDVSNAIDQQCYHCWPDNPYDWTSVGLVLVALGALITLLCWWKPKS